jgi:hypothetical protein
MQRKIFQSLRRAGAFRLALLYYATLVPAFPALVVVMAGFDVERARGLFIVWSRGALLLLLAPVAIGAFLWGVAWLALYIEGRR